MVRDPKPKGTNPKGPKENSLKESLQDDMLGCFHTYFFSPFNLPYKTADMVESLQDTVLVRVLACYPEPSPQMFRTGLC